LHRHIRFLIVAIGVLTIWSNPFHSAQTVEQATIEGRIIDVATGLPVPRASVTLTPGGQLSVADAVGAFKISNVSAGRYRIVPAANGYIPAPDGESHTVREPGEWLDVNPGEKIASVQLNMQRPSVIQGRLLAGTLASGIRVFILRWQYDDFGQRRLMPLARFTYPQNFRIPDDRGQFRFYDLQAGEYYLATVGGSSGNAVMTLQNSYYYPGGEREENAIAIRVRPGEEVHLPDWSLNPEPNRHLSLKLTRPAELLNSRPPGVAITFEGYGATGSIQADFNPVLGPIDSIDVDFPPVGQELQVRLRDSSQLFYSNVSIEPSTTDVVREVVFAKFLTVTAEERIQTEDGLSSKPSTLGCRIRPEKPKSSSTRPCDGSKWEPGVYRIELQGVPDDVYVISATAGERDVLRDGLRLSEDTNLQLLLRRTTSVVNGVVLNAAGQPQGDAVVALVPDAPLRSAGPLYKSVISDVHGRYSFHGIRPGSYHLFAWTDLEGAGFRNAAFLMSFEDRGKPIEIRINESATIELQTLTSP
jgi:uncharacterized protein (DUF2141 family)